MVGDLAELVEVGRAVRQLQHQSGYLWNVRVTPPAVERVEDHCHAVTRRQ